MEILGTISRRRLLAAGLCGCLLCGSARALARLAPNALRPLVEPGYRPEDADEKGLWHACERVEEEIAASNLLMKTPSLHRYTLGVLERLMGRQARDLRVYLVHDASFNASMFPNGMMLVHSGFLARVRSEAQFAAVLGHEGGHFARKHSVQGWRDQRVKTGFMAFVSAGTSVAVGAAASAGGDPYSWVDLARTVNSALLLSIFSFSRGQESEADLYGLKLLGDAGYAPEAAAAVWRQLIEERKASARQRRKRYRDDARSAFSTHPPTSERMDALGAAAVDIRQASASRTFEDGREAWARAIAPHQSMLLAEQVALNDPGASLYLLRSLAEDGWTGTLRYYEGEVYRLRDGAEDAARAASAYAAAVRFEDAPAEAWRAHGYALLKAGRGEEGRAALARYLDRAPNATDAAMVRFSIAQ